MGGGSKTPNFQDWKHFARKPVSRSSISCRSVHKESIQMTFSTIFPVVLGVAALTFISVRQMTWQRVKMEKLFKMPVLLAIAGVVVIASSMDTYTSAHVGGLDVVMIGVELCAAVFGGWLMGRLTQIDRRGEVAHSRLTSVGLAVWFSFIALRIGCAVAGGFLGAELAALPAMILFMIAIVKGVQALTIKERLDRLAVTSTRPERILSNQY